MGFALSGSQTLISPGLTVLRIIQFHDSEGPVLKLEGKWLAPWTEEVQAASAAIAAQTTQPRLDLKDVTYVDATGIKLLKSLQRNGFTWTACSAFVAAVLQTENIE